MKCRYCGARCHKKGKRNGRQIYRCIECLKYQRFTYRYRTYQNFDPSFLHQLSKEGMGISSVSRTLNIPKSTVIRLILNHAGEVENTAVKETGHEYEVDELRTYVGSKKNECWVCYAINRKTKKVIDFIAGRRTKENIGKVVKKVLSLSPTKVYTDRLNVYPGLIPEKLHSAKFRQTNYIERMNLTLRTHLKRLSYKTICYSRSMTILTACLKIYFWG